MSYALSHLMGFEATTLGLLSLQHESFRLIHLLELITHFIPMQILHFIIILNNASRKKLGSSVFVEWIQIGNFNNLNLESISRSPGTEVVEASPKAFQLSATQVCLNPISS